MKPEEQVQLGQAAEQLLRDPVLNKAWDDVRKSIHDLIENSKFDQHEQREDAYCMLRALTAVRGKIESHIRAAHGVQAEQKELRTRTVKRVAEMFKGE